MGEGDRGVSGERASPLTPTEAVRDAQQASVQLSHRDGEARCSPLEPCPPFLRWLRVALGMVTPGRFGLSKLPWCQESPKLRSRGEQVLVARSGSLGEKCLSVNTEAGGGDTVAIYGIC